VGGGKTSWILLNRGFVEVVRVFVGRPHPSLLVSEHGSVIVTLVEPVDS